jgi:hypothetical protein
VTGAEGEGDGDTNRGSYAMPLSRLAVKFGSGILLDDLFSGHWWTAHGATIRGDP